MCIASHAGAIGAADCDQPDLAVARSLDQRARHHCGGAQELPLQPVEHDLVFLGILGVAAVLVVARAAREVRALRAHARKRAIRDAVVVPVEIAVELGELLDLFLAQDLAAIRTIRVVPLELGAHPVVHADVEIRQHEHRRLQPVGEIEGRDREIEALLGVRREDQHVPRVAVRGVGAGAGCRPAACASACRSRGPRAGCRRSRPGSRRSTRAR